VRTGFGETSSLIEVLAVTTVERALQLTVLGRKHKSCDNVIHVDKIPTLLTIAKYRQRLAAHRPR
jgi:hypothetical protein